MDALSRSPIPVESDQRPIVLDEFPERVVLLVRSWDERVVARRALVGTSKSERRGRQLTPCALVQRLAEKPHAQRRGLRRQRSAARHVGRIQRAGAQVNEKSEDDGCQLVLTDAEESDDADAALVVPGKETDAAAVGTGEGGAALPKAFPNADLIATRAKDLDCLRYMQLVNKPQAQWPPHLAAAPLQFLYVAGVLCVQIYDVVRLGLCPDDEKTGRQSRRRRTRPSLGRPRIVLVPQTFGSELYMRTTSATTGDILSWPRHLRDWHCGIGGHGSALPSAPF